MRYFLSLLLTLFLSISGLTQEVTNGTGSWINLRLDTEWNDRISLDLTQSNRFDGIVGTFAVSNTTLKASYELNDWLRVTGGYRYMFRESRSRSFNRYQFALQAGAKWTDVKFSWRTRFEFREEIKRDNQVTRLRNKLTAGLKLRSIALESKVFVEYWYTFDDPLRDFSKYRVGISLSKPVTSHLDLKLGFNYDADLNQDELERESIALLGLTYNFERTKATK